MSFQILFLLVLALPIFSNVLNTYFVVSNPCSLSLLRHQSASKVGASLYSESWNCKCHMTSYIYLSHPPQLSLHVRLHFFFKLLGDILPVESGIAVLFGCYKIWLPHPLHVHSVPKWNSLPGLGSVLCHPPLGCEYVWLIIYCQFLLFSIRCYVLNCSQDPMGHRRDWENKGSRLLFPSCFLMWWMEFFKN